jgi:hypothetical protein
MRSVNKILQNFKKCKWIINNLDIMPTFCSIFWKVCKDWGCGYCMRWCEKKFFGLCDLML